MAAILRKSSIVASLLFSLLPMQAFAACGGAASSAALTSFNDDPAAWLSANAKIADLGSHVEAIAAAAVNANDPHFGKALNAMLARASADEGTAIGTAIAALGSACSDPRDPNDTADKQYISANIAPNLLANSNATAAYAKANGSETASGGLWRRGRRRPGWWLGRWPHRRRRRRCRRRDRNNRIRERWLFERRNDQCAHRRHHHVRVAADDIRRQRRSDCKSALIRIFSQAPN